MMIGNEVMSMTRYDKRGMMRSGDFKKRVICLFGVFAIVVCMTVSCGNSADDGVVIVPSDRGETVSADSSAATAPETETAAQTDVITAAETDAERADSVLVGGADVLEQARQMQEDAAFIQYLEQYGIEADHEDIRGVIAAVLSYQDVKNAETDVLSGAAVYWTAGGSVWHVSRECSALAKSKSVQSGEEADALAAGKTRVCKRCGE